MQLLIQFYPAIATTVAMFFYKRDNRRMQSFYRRMALSLSARKLFVSLLMIAMLIYNFCYLQANGMNVALWIGTVLCISMFSFRLAEKSLYVLQNRIYLAVAVIPMLVCVVQPGLLPISVNLYFIFMGSLFYPSRKLRNRLDNPETFTRFCANRDAAIKDYYSR